MKPDTVQVNDLDALKKQTVALTRLCATPETPEDEEVVDQYGNPISGDELIYCCFPDCGCDGARLCNAKNGASSAALSLNIERGSKATGSTS